MADRARLRAYYDAGSEWERLEGDEGWLEYTRTRGLITTHIPAGSRVLDLGGGPGRYTLTLAERGDDVTLADLSAVLVAEARQRLEAAGLTATTLVADAADLSGLPGAPFDAALALGPLYHAADAAELQLFIDQLAAVIRPGGVLLAAFIPRASAVSSLIAQSAAAPPAPGLLRSVLATGVLDNPLTGPAYFPEPDGLVEMLSGAFAVEAVVSLRGLGAGFGAQLRALVGEPAFAEVMETIAQTATRPDVIGTSWHAVAVARRR